MLLIMATSVAVLPRQKRMPWASSHQNLFITLPGVWTGSPQDHTFVSLVRLTFVMSQFHA